MPGSGGLWFLIFLALVPYFIVCATSKNLIKTALPFILIYYSGQLYWIAGVLSQYGKLPIAVGALAVVALAIFMGLYFLLFSAGFRFAITRLSPALSLWIIPIIWVGLDWLRGYLFTGFPWMDLGYGLAEQAWLIQVSDLFGHHGLTFLIIQINLIIFFIYQTTKDEKPTAKFFYPSFAISLIVLCCVGFYNNHKLTRWEQATPSSTVIIGIAQGNIDQSIKWSPSFRAASLNKYFNLTHALVQNKGAEIVLWPETALPFYPQSSPYTKFLKQSTKEYDYTLLTGAPWFEDHKEKPRTYYNSVQILTQSGSFTDSYYKSHLVPFGEYVPFREYLTFLAPLVETVGQMSPGTIDKPLITGQIKAGVLICFESVFPDLARNWTKSGANLLVNLTNDAWYGRSNAPYHTLAMTILRAVENRKSLVRSANTGISAFIEPSGKVTTQGPIFEKWARAEKVGLYPGNTIFTSWGYLFAPICFTITLLMGLICIIKNNLFFNRKK